MLKSIHRRAPFLVLAVVLATLGGVSATTAGATVEPAPLTARLVGSAHLDFWRTPDNDPGVVIDAHAVYDTKSRPLPIRIWGTARVFHNFQQPGMPTQVNWADVKLDCLTTGGPTAVVTGTVQKAAGALEPLARNHTRIGLSFYVSHKHSRVGITWGAAAGEAPIPLCSAPAATFPVIKGGFHLDGMPY